MTLHITPINQTLSLTTRQEGLEISAELPESTDVTLITSLAALVKISRQGMDQVDLEIGELEIQGDPILGQKFLKIITSLDIDWQNLLAEHVGEAPAQFISTSLSGVKEIAQQSQTQLKSTINNLLVDELELIAEPESVPAFLSEVDEISQKVDQLENRLQRVQNNLEQK